MSRAAALLCLRHRAALAAWSCALAAGLTALDAAAQTSSPTSTSAAAGNSDPTLVVARTVNPRIAYRAVPVQDDPVRAQATVFPAHAFSVAIGGTLGRLLGDDALAQRGSAGVAVDARTPSAAIATLLPRSNDQARAAGAPLAQVPLGSGPAAGGGIGGVTAGLAALINRSVLIVQPAKP
jgi:hypothetical protein